MKFRIYLIEYKCVGFFSQVFTHAILRDFHEEQTHTSEVQSNKKQEIIYDNTIIEVVELEVAPASVDAETGQPTYFQNVTPSDTQ